MAITILWKEKPLELDEYSFSIFRWFRILLLLRLNKNKRVGVRISGPSGVRSGSWNSSRLFRRFRKCCRPIELAKGMLADRRLVTSLGEDGVGHRLLGDGGLEEQDVREFLAQVRQPGVVPKEKIGEGVREVR